MGRVTVETDTPEKKIVNRRENFNCCPSHQAVFILLLLKKTLLLLNFWRDFYGEPYM